MEPRKTPPEYILEIFADTTTVRDVLKGQSSLATLCYLYIYTSTAHTHAPGVLNLIFFHRYFPSIRPVTFDVLDFTLPAINDADLETLIESRVSALVCQHLSSAAGTHDGKVGPGGSGGGGGVRGRIAVEFYEKKRRRSGLWFGGLAGKGEEEVCWEIWTLDVTIATPRTESGECLISVFLTLGYANPLLPQNEPKSARPWPTCSRRLR